MKKKYLIVLSSKLRIYDKIKNVTIYKVKNYFNNL